MAADAQTNNPLGRSITPLPAANEAKYAINWPKTIDIQTDFMSMLLTPVRLPNQEISDPPVA